MIQAGNWERWEDNFCFHALVPGTIYLSFGNMTHVKVLDSKGILTLEIDTHPSKSLVLSWNFICDFGKVFQCSLWLFNTSPVLDATWWAWSNYTKNFIVCVHFHTFVHMSVHWISLSLIFPFSFLSRPWSAHKANCHCPWVYICIPIWCCFFFYTKWMAKCREVTLHYLLTSLLGF